MSSSAWRSNNEAEGEEVFLAIYDLSHGVARTLSGQFLGAEHALDMIPHCGIVAWGREYFFGGGGIESCTPMEFRAQFQLQPWRTDSLGRTSRSRAAFEAWCRNQPAYNPYSYDLLRHNCNNFANDAARLGLGLTRGVPSFILDVPARVMASPMGQLLRPLLEEMQIGGPTGVLGRERPPGDFVTTAAAPTPAVAGSAPSPPVPQPPADFLDNHDQPLLSSDVGMVDVCVKKLPDEEEKPLLPSLAQMLKREATVDPIVLSEAVSFLLHKYVHQSDTCTAKKHQTQVVFALMLLRLVVLLRAPSAPTASTNVVAAVSDKLLGKEDETTNPFVVSPAVRCMAWCVLSNAIGTSAFATDAWPLLEPLLEASVSDVNAQEPDSQKQQQQQHQLEVRRSAAAFLYNTAHALSQVPGALTPLENDHDDALPQAAVIVLCGALGELQEETDSTACLRRLLAAWQVLRTRPRPVLQFCIELGFPQVLNSVKVGDDDNWKTASMRIRSLVALLDSP